MIVYVVHQGEYSDRRCIGVFSSKERADEHIAGDPSFDVHEYEVDELPKEYWVKDYFYVRVTPDGGYEEWMSVTGVRALTPDFRGKVYMDHNGEEPYYTAGSTVSYEHAKKLAVEAMQKHLRTKVNYEDAYQERVKEQAEKKAEKKAEANVKYAEDVAKFFR